MCPKVTFLVMGILERKVWNSTSPGSWTSFFFVLDPLSTFNCLVWNHHHDTFIFCLAAGLAIPPSRRLECSLPAEDRNVSNSVLHTGEMKAEFVRILPHVQSFFSSFPRDLYH